MDSLITQSVARLAQHTSDRPPDSTTPTSGADGVHAPEAEPLGLSHVSQKSKECLQRHRKPKMSIGCCQQTDGHRVIARLKDEELLLRAPARHEKAIAGECGEVHHAPAVLREVVLEPGSTSRSTVEATCAQCNTRLARARELRAANQDGSSATTCIFGSSVLNGLRLWVLARRVAAE